MLRAGDWSSADKLFGFRYSCSGGGAQVKKSQHTNGGFDIRFPGNPGRFAVANVADDGTKAISVVPEPDGSFHVTEAGNAPGETFPFRSDASFFIVLY